MRRMWPDEFNFMLDDAEEVTLTNSAPGGQERPEGQPLPRQALKVRISQQDYERIWPLAEMRHRLAGRFAGKAITAIVNNPHYAAWHPADGGSEDHVSDSGRHYTTQYVVVYFLLDDVRETATA